MVPLCGHPGALSQPGLNPCIALMLPGQRVHRSLDQLGDDAGLLGRVELTGDGDEGLVLAELVGRDEDATDRDRDLG